MNCESSIDYTTKIKVIKDKYENTFKVQKELLMSKYINTYDSNNKNLIDNLENNIDCLNNNFFLIENILTNKNNELNKLIEEKKKLEKELHNKLVDNKREYIVEKDDREAAVPRYYNTELDKLVNNIDIFSKLGFVGIMSYLIYKKVKSN
jgi:HD-GYP domain-containing protein (c-di-GMP phosphodiesterase class II)